eukprot:PhM_4_TR1160/c0_g1_i1/m.51662
MPTLTPLPTASTAEPFNYSLKAGNVDGFTALNLKDTSVMVSMQKFVDAPIPQRRAIACNNKYIVYSFPNHPNARITHKLTNSQRVLKGHKGTIVDICFLSNTADVLVTAGSDGLVLLHHITEGETIHTTTIGGFDLGEGRHPVGVLPSVSPSASTVEALGQGQLLVASSENKLHAYSISAMYTAEGQEPKNAYEVPSVSLPDVRGDFCTDNEGKRVAVSSDSMVTVFIMPSPASHANWAPHAGDNVTALQFGTNSDTLITCANQNGSIRVWSLADVTPSCVQSLSLGDGTGSWKFQLDVSRSHAFFLLSNSTSGLILNLGAAGCFESAAELELEKSTHTHVACTARSKFPDEISVVVRYDDAIRSHTIKRSELLADAPSSASAAFPRQSSESPATTGSFDLSSIFARVNSQQYTPQQQPANLMGTPQQSNNNNNAGAPTSKPPQGAWGGSFPAPYSSSPQLTGLPGPTAATTTTTAPPQRQQQGMSEAELLAQMSAAASSAAVAGPKVDLDQMVSNVTATTDSIVVLTKKVAELQSTILDLAQSSTSLSSSSGGSSKAHQEDTKDVKEILAPVAAALQALPSRIDDIVSRQITSYTSGVVAASCQAVQNARPPGANDTLGNIKGPASSIMRQIKESIRCDQISASINEFSRTVNAKAQPSVKEVVAQFLAARNLDAALNLVLEQRNPDLVMWLIREAEPLSVWADQVVDTVLNPTNVLSLFQTLCSTMGAGTHAAMQDQTVAGEMISFLCEAAVSYNAAWKEAISADVYSQVRTISLTSLQKYIEAAGGEANVPETRSMKRVLRLLQQ